jgi:hypothetical protein
MSGRYPINDAMTEAKETLEFQMSMVEMWPS